MERGGACCVCVRAFRSAAVVHGRSWAQTRARSRKPPLIPFHSFRFRGHTAGSVTWLDSMGHRSQVPRAVDDVCAAARLKARLI
jgi:hypothetical protein